jgi:predicted TIM-barrel fold metal-dependent hydrolase
MREWAELGYEDETMEKIFHGNAERILGFPLNTDQRRETRI